MAPYIHFTTENEAGDEVTHELPAKYEVCPRCEGRGTHVNPNVDGPGISAEEFADDPDFAQDYFSGVYDVTCHECKGLRVVPIADEDRCPPELLKAYQAHLRDEAEYQAQIAYEQRMGY